MDLLSINLYNLIVTLVYKSLSLFIKSIVSFDDIVLSNIDEINIVIPPNCNPFSMEFIISLYLIKIFF